MPGCASGQSSKKDVLNLKERQRDKILFTSGISIKVLLWHHQVKVSTHNILCSVLRQNFCQNCTPLEGTSLVKGTGVTDMVLARSPSLSIGTLALFLPEATGTSGRMNWGFELGGPALIVVEKTTGKYIDVYLYTLGCRNRNWTSPGLFSKDISLIFHSLSEARRFVSRASFHRSIAQSDDAVERHLAVGSRTSPRAKVSSGLPDPRPSGDFSPNRSKISHRSPLQLSDMISEQYWLTPFNSLSLLVPPFFLLCRFSPSSHFP